MVGNGHSSGHRKMPAVVDGADANGRSGRPLFQMTKSPPRIGCVKRFEADERFS